LIADVSPLKFSKRAGATNVLTDAVVGAAVTVLLARPAVCARPHQPPPGQAVVVVFFDHVDKLE